MSRIMWALAGVWSLVAILPAQSASLDFFPCGTVAFFGDPCPSAPQTVPVAVLSPAQQEAPAASPQPPVSSVQAAPPLFAPETVALDMPPLLLDVLQSPTHANARRFVAWYRTRLRRIQEVRDLIQRVAETPDTTPAPSVAPLPAQRR